MDLQKIAHPFVILPCITYTVTKSLPIAFVILHYKVSGLARELPQVAA